MPVMPSMLVGIGAFGRAVLNETAIQMRQSYGEAGVTALGWLALDVTPPADGLDPAITAFQVGVDARDWLEEERPALSEWFQAEHYRTRWASFRGEIRERQQARLSFFRYLARSPRQLTRHLQGEFERLLRGMNQHTLTLTTDQDKRSLNVYLLGAASDVAMRGLVFDIAHVLRLVTLPLDMRARLLLHMALPGSTSNSLSEEAQAAEIYVLLRELERFGLAANAGNIPRSIAYDSLESALQKVDDQYPLIYATRLFSTDDRASAVQMADCLLPQLDFQFGMAVAQHELVNMYAEKVGMTDITYMVGTQDIRSAIFPRLPLLAGWQREVGLMALERWLRPPASATQSENFLQSWLGGRALPHPDDPRREITAPTLLNLVRDWGNTRDNPSLLAGDASTTTAQTEALLTRGAVSLASGRWLEDNLTEQVKQFGTQMIALHNWLKSQLLAQYGSLLNDAPRREGAYWQQLTAARAEIEAQFGLAVQAFLLAGLNRGVGLRQMLDFTAQLVTMLNKAARISEIALIQVRKNALSTLGSLALALDEQVQYLEAIPARPRLGFGRNPQQRRFETYIETAYQIAVQLRHETELDHLAVLFLSLRDRAHQEMTALARWEESLLTAQGALSQQVRQTPLPPQTSAPHRLWLHDAGWEGKQAATLFSTPFYDRLLTALHWEKAASGLFPVVDGTPLHLERPATHAAIWLRFIQTALENVSLNVWDYVLSVEAQAGHLPELTAFLNRGERALSYLENVDAARPPRINRFLLLPQENHPPVAEMGFRESLMVGVKASPQIVQEAHPSRLARLSLTEFVPLRAVTHFQRGETAFRSLSMTERARRLLTVFPEEAFALPYENLIQTTFGLPRFGFSPLLLRVFAYPERVRLYLWLVAAGFVTTSRNGATLITLRDGRRWWLTQNAGAKPSQILAAFCFSEAHPVAFQETEESAALYTPISYAVLQGAVEAALAEATHEWQVAWSNRRRPFPAPDIQHWIHELQTTPCHYQAAELGFRFSVLGELSRQMRAELPGHPEPEVARLWIVMAEREAEAIRSKIVTMVQTRDCG